LDTGRNPAAVITQIDPRGRMLVLGECVGLNMGMEMFIDTVFRPYMYQEKFNGVPVYLVVDPASLQRSQIGEESVLQALHRMGFAAVRAQTNAIEPRIRSVEKWLQQSIGGKAAMLFDPEGCPELLLGMSARYRYKRKKDGSLEENSPEKNHPYSDLADALQYACLGGSAGVKARAMRRLMPYAGGIERVQTGGWT
jgi:hypothetical protein